MPNQKCYPCLCEAKRDHPDATSGHLMNVAHDAVTLGPISINMMVVSLPICLDHVQPALDEQVLASRREHAKELYQGSLEQGSAFRRKDTLG